jgi:ribosome-associated protein
VTATDHALAIAKTAAQAAFDKQATEIVLLDVSEHLVITDLFLICTAQNERQVSAIIDAIEEALDAQGVEPIRREGQRGGRWVLLDYFDMVVHVQQAEERSLYDLERLWRDCPHIPMELH